MNAFGQFTTAIDGQRIHFLHARSAESDALPLIITHGWPGSVVEFMYVIGPLTDPAAHGGAQGGDWGSTISRELGPVAPGRLAGVHLNMLFPYAAEEPADLTDQDRARLEALRRFRSTGSGYFAIQSTRPQTLAYGLTDSPAGQLAWITEKFGEWTDGGRPDEAVDRDQLLTNITL